MNGVGALSPTMLSKLLDIRLSLVPLKNTDPEIRLPPVFGTTFIVRPPVSFSPRPPDVLKVTSSALPTSAT